MQLEIVSGGQTGVDRAALDVALAHGLACGGWCPAGRRAEDGPIAQRYPLRATSSRDYAERTRLNVRDSDGTLIICFGPPSGGTALTRRVCRELGRPCRLVDGDRLAARDAARVARHFIRKLGIRVLNVAGPRASTASGAYGYATAVLEALIGELSSE